MNKIWLITQRELFTRIRKRSFIIMTVLGPLLFAGYFALSIFFALQQDTDIKKIAVCDSTGVFLNKIPNNKYVTFEYIPVSNFQSVKKVLKNSGYYGILYISPIVAYSPRGVEFYSYNQPGNNITQHISNAIEKELRDQKLLSYKIADIDNILKSVESKVDIVTVKLSDSGEEKQSHGGLKMALAYISSFLIYMFIMMFGVQVMRGVIEEKSNRIIEVIISSVKPFQLMMGKVLGIAIAAIMQFTVWIILSIVLISFVKMAFLPDILAASVANHQPQDLMTVSPITTQSPQIGSIPPEVAEALSVLDSINFIVIIAAFLFYFIGGYLLYASLFAAVGASVDNDSDTQQFVIPITLPLILGIMVMVNAFQNPDGSLAFWFSIFPLTSPIVMMARIPYGVPYEQVAISMVLLIATFVGSIWMAGKIYRTGILMYGKKASYKEVFKWLKYK